MLLNRSKIGNARRSAIRGCLVTFAVFAAARLAEAQTYTVVNLGNFNGSYPSATAYGVNGSGQVAGSSQYDSSSSHVHAFLYSSLAMTDLGVLSGSVSRGYGINDAGQVVGQSFNKAVVNISGSWVNITSMDASYSSSGQANAINTAGKVVGTNSNGSTSSAFIYSGGASGTVTSLGTLGGFYSEAKAINSSDTVVGYSYLGDNTTMHAFRYSGSMQDLGVYGSDTMSRAWGINASGIIVGDSGNGASVSHAVYFDGTWHDLGTLGGGTSSYAYGINSAGVIVGSSVEGTLYQTHAFVYTTGASMVDLNSLVDLSGSGLLYLQSARSINDAGWIVGDAVAAGGTNAAFLLMPTAIPEPSTSAALAGLLALGLAAYSRRRRRSD